MSRRTHKPLGGLLSTAVVCSPERFDAARPLLIRGATVVTMDKARGVLPDTDCAASVQKFSDPPAPR